jgi:hypothetical protein
MIYIYIYIYIYIEREREREREREIIDNRNCAPPHFIAYSSNLFYKEY